MNITLITNWRESYKFLSMKLLALIFIFPDIYTQISSAGYLEGAPHSIMISMRILASLGMIARLINQDKDIK